MTFPILNISSEKWKNEDLMDYIVFDEFIYTNKDSIFNELYKDKLFCDCNGRVFKAIKKAELTQKWRNWFRFIPNVWKREVIFEPIHKKLSVDELRNYLLERVSELENNELSFKWKAELKNAKTYSELINGK